MGRSGELERIYQAVVNDLDKWDGQKPLGDFIAEILEKRLLLSKEEAKSVSEKLLLGIENYKHAKEFVKKNPEIVGTVIKNTDESVFKNVVIKFLDLLSSVKGGKDGTK